jgi:hypothetical protein
MRVVGSFSHKLRTGASKFLENDNVTLHLEYEDGSRCMIDYIAVGSRELPKEYMEVHFDEKSLVMTDYKSLSGHGVRAKLATRISEKGQLEELVAVHAALTAPMPTWPIEWWDLVQTTEISLGLAY